jgi:hypothetical protein
LAGALNLCSPFFLSCSYNARVRVHSSQGRETIQEAEFTISPCNAPVVQPIEAPTPVSCDAKFNARVAAVEGLNISYVWSVHTEATGSILFANKRTSTSEGGDTVALKAGSAVGMLPPGR